MKVERISKNPTRIISKESQRVLKESHKNQIKRILKNHLERISKNPKESHKNHLERISKNPTRIPQESFEKNPLKRIFERSCKRMGTEMVTSVLAKRKRNGSQTEAAMNMKSFPDWNPSAWAWLPLTPPPFQFNN